MLVSLFFFAADSDTADEVVLVKKIKIHRSRLHHELAEVFQDSDILNFSINFTVIDQRGNEEEGTGDGVLRDVICTFVSNLAYSHMIGCEEKVPLVHHDMGLQQWKSVARILVYGSKLNYFPLSLSPVIFTAALFGEEFINVDCFIDGFKQYVSAEERDLLDLMFDSSDEHNEELMDLLSSYNCFRVPKKNNVKNIIVELAHQELMQNPKYIINCFGMVFGDHLLKKSRNVNSIYDFYKEKMPTPTKVVKKLLFSDELNEGQKQVSDFLKKYIKSLDKKDLKLFLRFVVGSGNMPMEINVFCKQTIRAPRSRLCINQLELEESYQYFNELAEEFTAILTDPNSFRFSFI